MISRRRFLIGASAGGLAAAGIGAAVAASGGRSPSRIRPLVLPSQPPGLPPRQFAWDQVLRHDRYGNAITPRYGRLVFFDVTGHPGREAVRLLEAALRELEGSWRWGSDGLLFVAGWGSAYFTDVLGVPAPIPRARALSEFELPEIDDYHLCLHLACDHGQRLLAVDRALRRRLAPALRWRESRTGFVGAGLPAAHQRVGGIPGGSPVPRTAPMYMGFKSNFRKNQASEDAITIGSGAFAEGTTMQVSYMRLRLDSWYRDLDDAQRVARMYSPQTTPTAARQFTTDAESDPGELRQAIDRYGVIGHAQTSASVRRHGSPLILRRDFDTDDGGQAGLHFVSLQRTIADFVTTRTAMNAANAQLANPAITDTVNNGINEWIFVVRRANYIVPSRAQRSFPLLPGRSGMLAVA